MSIDAVQPRAELERPRTGRDRHLTRLLRLLETDQDGGLTIAALRERGIETPAMSVYELQLAGYEIERVPCEHRNGRTTLAYRLRCPGADADQSVLKEVASDGISR
jgi:hypothetical protein